MIEVDMDIDNSMVFMNNYLEIYKYNRTLTDAERDDPAKSNKENFLVWCRLYSSAVSFIRLTGKGVMEKRNITFSMVSGMVNWFWAGESSKSLFAFGFSDGSIVITTVNPKTWLPYNYPKVALISPLCNIFEYKDDSSITMNYSSNPIHWLSGNEDMQILASLSNTTIWTHSLNNGQFLNQISLSKICRNIYGLELSKWGFVIAGRSNIGFVDPDK